MFFSSWVCPQLASFHGKCVFPYLSLSNTLTACYLHVRNDHNAIRPVNDYGDFPGRLASLTSLKKLVFHLEIVDTHYEPRGYYLGLKSPAMNALEELHIIHERTDEGVEGMRPEGFDSAHFFKTMFARMELPALKTLVFQFVLEENVFRNIQEVMPVASRCPNLRRLTLKHRLFEEHDGDVGEIDEYMTAGPTGFQVLSPLFPQIHHLELDGSGLCQFSNEVPVNESLPPLHTITLRGCTDKRFVVDLVLHIRRGPHWNLFETLELDACEELSDPNAYGSIRALLDDDLGVWKLVVDGDTIG